MSLVYGVNCSCNMSHDSENETYKEMITHSFQVRGRRSSISTPPTTSGQHIVRRVPAMERVDLIYVVG